MNASSLWVVALAVAWAAGPSAPHGARAAESAPEPLVESPVEPVPELQPAPDAPPPAPEPGPAPETPPAEPEPAPEPESPPAPPEDAVKPETPKVPDEGKAPERVRPPRKRPPRTPPRVTPPDCEREADASLQFYVPEGDVWSSALGVSIEHTRWIRNRWGWGPDVSLARWSASGGELDLPFAKFNPFTLDGSALVFQAGVHGGFRHPLGEKTAMVIKAGLAYLYADSSLELSAAYTNYYNQDVQYRLYAENISQLVGRIGLSIRRDFTWEGNDLYAQAGADYQARLAGDETSLLHENLEAHYDAISVRLGIGLRW